MSRKTERKRVAIDRPADAGPAIILVAPQLGENIGTAARAMFNCALTDLRLVRPRDGWPSERAVAASSGAVEVIEGARVFESTSDAIAGLNRVYATTARRRAMIKPVLTPRRAAAEMRAAQRAGETVGVLFGQERKGLHNDDVTLADAVIEIPLNPAYRSLNLAQAVLLIAYEWWMAEETGESPPELPMPDTRPATREELVGFFEHLERELDEAGFLYPPEKRPAMVRNIRNLFLRAAPTEQEIRTLRGVVSDLSKRRRS